MIKLPDLTVINRSPPIYTHLEKSALAIQNFDKVDTKLRWLLGLVDRFVTCHQSLRTLFSIHGG